ncbi:MAG TPA: hypothetical protein PLA83_10970 [Deltaproteobacteria bacterium]|jgi:hypothetical protein|nr:hypothetical protein [Deltaproteobacteria bacterium]HQJ08781.1 hypothetical protein [Deltaproteobacteria bacterium]
MAYFRPEHRSLLVKSSVLAEGIVSKEMRWSGQNVYDVTTLAESPSYEVQEGVFAQLLLLEPRDARKAPIYRICLHDTEIFDFIRRNREVDLASLFTFIMTHELLHIHRFATGKADFYGENREDEEEYVDMLTRLFLAKNPITGLKNVLTLLDKVEAAPLYNFTKFVDRWRNLDAYL